MITQPHSLPIDATNQTLALMKASHRWLLCKSVPRPNGKDAKIPYYANGKPRSGALDTPEDRAQLVTYDEAMTAAHRSPGVYAWVGFALGPDGNGGNFQGIDLDDISANQLSSIANEWTVGAYEYWCYTELSPSGAGMHVIGYGQPFPPLGPNGTGIEAYSSGRFFAFTGDEVLSWGEHGRLGDLFDYIEGVLRPRWLKGKIPRDFYAGEAKIIASPTTIAALRSAIHFWNPNNRGEWISAGMALKDLGTPGFEIWNTWSQYSLEKYDPKDAIRVWESFKPNGGTSYQSIFKIAQNKTIPWVNPDGKESLRVRFCSCGATVALPPLRLNLATGELNVAPNGQGGRS